MLGLCKDLVVRGSAQKRQAWRSEGRFMSAYVRS